ncbi:hypothetical protein E5D57_012308 [Metarhizium anisopliae]|nr:hypothetical protein E5D57_012308 [Metarhizium anisopliae]
MPPRLALQFTSLWTLSLRGSRHFQIRRTFHDAKADFITFDSRGSLTTQKLDIFIGEPHEAYIIFNKDVGLAMKSAAVPYPRMVIERSLPRQNASNTSPATLWLWGASHSITLDGTADYMFEEPSRESHKRLKGAAELLRDR